MKSSVSLENSENTGKNRKQTPLGNSEISPKTVVVISRILFHYLMQRYHTLNMLMVRFSLIEFSTDIDQTVV